MCLHCSSNRDLTFRKKRDLLPTCCRVFTSQNETKLQSKYLSLDLKTNFISMETEFHIFIVKPTKTWIMISVNYTFAINKSGKWYEIREIKLSLMNDWFLYFPYCIHLYLIEWCACTSPKDRLFWGLQLNEG